MKTKQKIQSGYFGIGVYRPKTSYNIGTLWRSAFQMGASFIFTIEKRYKKQASDTYKTINHIPLLHFESFSSFRTSVNCPIIGIEFEENSMPIKDFSHLKKCTYLLGSEDNGLPKKIIEQLQGCISLPSVRTQSYNVAVSGSLVMFHRLLQRNI
ncbi:MAG: RNA methyltransferase [archaeon]|nr:RNA methyltransferase [archaeon]